MNIVQGGGEELGSRPHKTEEQARPPSTITVILLFAVKKPNNLLVDEARGQQCCAVAVWRTGWILEDIP